MAKWSVALFGHYKPRFELREVAFSDHIPVVAHGYHGEPYYYDIESYSEPGKGYAGTGYHKMTTDIKMAGTVKSQKSFSQHVEMPVDFDDKKHFIYNVVGWEKRAEPGDVISYKPYKSDYPPGSSSIMVSVDELTRGQVEVLCESQWDIDSYKVYAPLAYVDWYGMMYLKAEAQLDKVKTLALLEENKLTWYDEYIKNEKEKCAYPTTHLKKRRFNIPQVDLEILGVDIAKMQNTNIVYQPKPISLSKTQYYDKLNSRYISEMDKLNFIKPLTFEKM